MVTVRLGPLPPNTIFSSGTRYGLEEQPVTVNLSADVSGSLMLNGMGEAGVSSSVDWSEILEMVGGSFTGLTVNRNLVLAVAPPASLTVIVMVAVPYRLGRGVKATVRLVPSPVKMISPSVT